MEKYINLFTDFGFKKIFGTEVNKDLLIDFLNELLKGREEIKSLTYLKNEHLGNTPVDRKAVFNLYCENPQGEKFIIELQKVYQEFFKDRSLYYSTFAITEQAKQGKGWHYELKAVYTVGILDFTFGKKKEDKFQSVVQLVDTETCKVFYEKLTFVYLEIPKFNKTEEELESHFDKWLFLIRNLHKLDKIPEKIQAKVFERLFEQAEIAKYEPKDHLAYEDSKKHYLDLNSTLYTAKREEKIEIAKNLLRNEVDLSIITISTGLSKEQVNELRKDI